MGTPALGGGLTATQRTKCRAVQRAFETRPSTPLLGLTTTCYPYWQLQTVEVFVADPSLDRPERAALVLFQKFDVTHPGGVLTLANFLDHADFVGLSRGELAYGIDGLVRRGFLQPVQVPRDACANRGRRRSTLSVGCG